LIFKAISSWILSEQKEETWGDMFIVMHSDQNDHT
jgi:hypothetical protein